MQLGKFIQVYTNVRNAEKTGKRVKCLKRERAGERARHPTIAVRSTMRKPKHSFTAVEIVKYTGYRTKSPKSNQLRRDATPRLSSLIASATCCL